jgi:hypothetical protein
MSLASMADGPPPIRKVHQHGDQWRTLLSMWHARGRKATGVNVTHLKRLVHLKINVTLEWKLLTTDRLCELQIA